MNQRERLLSLFFIMVSVAGATFYLIWKVPLSLYIGWGSIAALAVVAGISLPSPASAIEIALTTSFILAAGALIAHVGFHDPPAAWFFLIAAVFSLPIVLFASRYLMRSISLKGVEASEPQQQGLWQRLGWFRWLSLGLTAALLGITAYLGWRTWPKVSGNFLILAIILLIFFALGSTVIKRADKKLEHWLSVEGLLALSNILYELFLPLMFVLLLLDFVMK